MNPFAGSRLRLSIIGSNALATRNHLRNAKNLFTRNPMMKTTNGPSTAAVNRPAITVPIRTSPLNALRPRHELRQKSVEMMHAAFARRRVTAAVVQARAHAALHRFDDRLSLTLHAIQPRPGALAA